MALNVERLLKIAEITENTPQENFNMSSWKVQMLCGTVACAIGNAASHPDIIAQGLHLYSNIDNTLYESLFPRYIENGIIYDNFEAISKFIGDNKLSELAILLFHPDYYPENVSPKYVAKCIKYVANGGDTSNLLMYTEDKLTLWTNLVPKDD